MNVINHIVYLCFLIFFLSVDPIRVGPHFVSVCGSPMVRALLTDYKGSYFDVQISLFCAEK